MIALEASKTLLLDRDAIFDLAQKVGFRLSLGSCNRPSEIYNLSSFGVVAQLVERLNGIEEVRGSIPLGSTFSTDVDA